MTAKHSSHYAGMGSGCALLALLAGFVIALAKDLLYDNFFAPHVLASLCPFFFVPVYAGRLISDKAPLDLPSRLLPPLVPLLLPLLTLLQIMAHPSMEIPPFAEVLPIFVPYGLFLLGLFTGPVAQQPEKAGRSLVCYLVMAVATTVLLALCLGCMTAPLLLFLGQEVYDESDSMAWLGFSSSLSLLGVAVALDYGRRLASAASFRATFAARYLPLLLPPLLFLSLSLYFMRTDHSVPLLLYQSTGMASLLLYGLFLFGFGCEIRTRRQGPARGRRVGVVCLLLVLVPPCAVYAVNMVSLTRENYSSVHDVIPSLDWKFAQKYLPREEDNALTLPSAPPSLRLGASPRRLDGTLAALPLYASALQALTCLDEDGRLLSWRERNERLTRERVEYSERYEQQRLAAVLTDIFFGPPPSRRQLDELRAQGLTPEVRPVAREALVFFVQKDNPVRSLSSEQLRRIYTGEIANWKEVGGRDERILPFQHEAEDENQLLLEELVLRGEAAAPPLQEDYLPFSSSALPSVRVARYRKRIDALGFGLRWYLGQWFPDGDFRPLSVDGVLPTDATLRDGSYPLIVPLCLIACRPLDDDSRAFRDWLLGPEGRALIRRAGYLPWDGGNDGDAGKGKDTEDPPCRGR